MEEAAKLARVHDTIMTMPLVAPLLLLPPDPTLQTPTHLALPHPLLTPPFPPPSLPQGYDTVVGERGLKLSGGDPPAALKLYEAVRVPPQLLHDSAESSPRMPLLPARWSFLILY